jgi:glycosyltransferase involved in cell wall biosynthesis
MKILISSLCPLIISGYSIQLNKLIIQLLKHDASIEIGVVCWNLPIPISSLEGFSLDELIKLSEMFKVGLSLNEATADIYKNVKFYIPGQHEKHWSKIHAFALQFKPDKLLVYQDIFIFDTYDISSINCKKYIWLPVHSAYLPHELLQFEDNINKESLTLKHLPFFDKIATFSKFGVDLLHMFGYKSVFINHMVDGNFFYNMNVKNETRNKFSILTTDFVCLMIARNGEASDRKAYFVQLEAFAKFAEDKPNAKLIIHDNYMGPEPLVNISKVIDVLNIKSKIIGTTMSFRSNEDIRDLYQMADVLLCASRSEGFGLPMVEAQFCELLVITTNCTSMPDNTYYGICTEPAQISQKVYNRNGWSDPSCDAIVNTLNDIYTNDLDKYPIKPIDKTQYDENLLIKDWVTFLELD